MNPNVIVSGVISGILYAIAAISLVIVYRASRLINFALGGMGGLAAYIAYQLLLSGQSYWLGYAAAIVTGMVVGGLTELLIIRRLAGAEHIVAGLGTLGVLLILQGVIVLKWGTETHALPEVLGTGQAIRWGQVRISRNDIFIVGVAILLLILMYLLIKRTTLGLRMRATAEGEVTASLAGVNVRAVSRWSWIIGGAGGSVAALLVIPTQTLAAGSFTNFLFFGFAAVVLGGLASTTSVIVGGVAFGLLLNVIAYYLPSQITDTLALVVVTAILLLRPNGILGVAERKIAQVAGLRASGFRKSHGRGGWVEKPAAGETLNTPRPGPEPLARRSLLASWPRVTRWLIAGVVLALFPLFVSGGLKADLPTFSATILAVLSLTVLYGVAGKVSVGNGAFIGIGAYATAILQQREHVPFLFGILLAGVICFVMGGIVGLPALRVKSYVYFSVYTFMIANALPELINYFDKWTGGENGLAITAPKFVGLGIESQYWFYLAFSAIVCGAVALLLRSRIGRRWRASRDSAAGAEAAGVNTATATILAFAVSGALAGMSGALQGAAVGILSPDSYTIWISVYLLVGVIAGGSGRIAGAIIGAGFITFVPYLTGFNSKISPDLIFGIILILVISFAPGGTVTAVTQAAHFVRRQYFAAVRSVTGRRAADGAIPKASPPPAIGAGARASIGNGVARLRLRARPTAEPGLNGVNGVNGRNGTHRVVGAGLPLLTVQSLSVAYDDLVAVSGIDLSVRDGEVVALLGPNGAGKSSTIRAIGGVARVRRGSIIFNNEEIVGLPPWSIARRGIASVSEGRGIFPGLTVDENLSLGGLLAADRRKAQRESRAVVFESFPDLAGRRKQLGGTLSGGQQQMLAIGRALMSSPKLLALDEPSLGLSPLLAAEVFASLAVMKQAGTTMLVIEQNSTLALELADSVCVLRDGHIQLSCGVDEARNNASLIAEYLGVTADRG